MSVLANAARTAEAERNEAARLFHELRDALSRTSAEDMKSWGQDAVMRLPSIGKRRIRNLGNLVASLTKATVQEVKTAIRKTKEGSLRPHLEQRAAAGIDKTIELTQQLDRTTKAIIQAIQNDPKQNAPGLLAMALGFIAGSGGADGNSGIPDTDIAMFGFGNHRSLFTHSILAGIVVEGAILAVADLAGIVCRKLPEEQRSAFWDQLENSKDQIAQQLATGASAGIAFHLAVDATLQPAAYKDLPVSMPMEAHQILFAVNAAAEGSDAVARQKTTGEKIVGSISNGLGRLGSGLKKLSDRH